MKTSRIQGFAVEFGRFHAEIKNNLSLSHLECSFRQIVEYLRKGNVFTSENL